jgi:hypothetical protein
VGSPVEGLTNETLRLEGLKKVDDLHIGDGESLRVLLEEGVLGGDKGSLCNCKQKKNRKVRMRRRSLSKENMHS